MIKIKGKLLKTILTVGIFTGSIFVASAQTKQDEFLNSIKTVEFDYKYNNCENDENTAVNFYILMKKILSLSKIDKDKQTSILSALITNITGTNDGFGVFEKDFIDYGDEKTKKALKEFLKDLKDKNEEEKERIYDNALKNIISNEDINKFRKTLEKTDFTKIKIDEKEVEKAKEEIINILENKIEETKKEIKQIEMTNNKDSKTENFPKKYKEYIEAFNKKIKKITKLDANKIIELTKSFTFEKFKKVESRKIQNGELM